MAPSTPRPTDSLCYRRDIDGLRAIAVLSVILFHYFPEHVPGGFIGVDVFFVISGFLISRLLWDALDKGTFSLGGFYASRVRRIFPALAIVLLVTWILGRIFLFWDDFGRLGLHILAGALFFSNFALWEEGGYFDIAAERKPLLHLWSLSIEEQFYLVWPLLLVLLHKLRARFWLVGYGLLVASLAYDASLLPADRAAAFYNPLGRAWELIFGALVGWRVRTHGTLQGRGGVLCSTAALGTILGCSVGFSPAIPFPGMLALVPVAAAGLLLASGGSEHSLRGVLVSRVAVGIGLISYPLYLWHWPLFSFAHLTFYGDIPVAVKLALMLAAVALAAVTFRYVERPIRHSPRSSRLVIALVALVFGIGMLGAFTAVRRGFVASSNLPAVAPYLTESNPLAAWLAAVRAGRCHIQEQNVVQHAEECVEAKRPLVLLWGDSHAAALYPGLAELQKSVPFGLAQMTSSGCPPLPDSYSVAYSRCDEINRRVLEEIKRLQPEVVILASSWRHAHLPRSNEMITNKCAAQIDAVRERAPKARIVIVGPLLRWDPGIAQVLASHVGRTGEAPPQRLPRQDTPDNRKRAELTAILERLAAEKSVGFLAPDTFFCDTLGCLTRFADTRQDFVSFDGEHLNPKASAMVAEGLRPLLFSLSYPRDPQN
jgi:peptidoglycan/LPS O-acetylase OafA/YrhL